MVVRSQSRPFRYAVIAALAVTFCLSSVASVVAQPVAQQVTTPGSQTWGGTGIGFGRNVMRVVYAPQFDASDVDAILGLRAFEAVLAQAVPAVWIRPDGVATAGPEGVEASLVAYADERQALAVLNVTITHLQEHRYRYNVRILQSSNGRLVGESSLEIEIDRAGRYLGTTPWVPLTDDIQAAFERVTDVVPMTFVGLPGTRVEGYGVLAEIDEGGTASYNALRYHSYTIWANKPGHRSERVTVYTDRQPMTIDFTLHRYPRHSLGIFAREFAFPELEYAYYDEMVKWVFGGAVTSYAIGVIPFDPNMDGTQRPELIQSLPLSQFTALAGRLSGNRDHRVRSLFQVGAFVRLMHGEGLFRFEPALPSGLTARLGLEVELSQRFVASLGVISDLYWPARHEFVPERLLMTKVGPVWMQTGLLRAGLRVVL